jgi:K+-sensing histidine kinase KdpD
LDSNVPAKSGNKPGGLGINVLKKIIELSGGTISVANRHEAGNKYTVMFKVPRQEPG